MPDAENDLVRYNVKGILSNLLSIEEHLEEGGEKISHSWCAKKHALLTYGHHGKELVNHCSALAECSVEKYREFIGKLGVLSDKPSVSIEEVRALRNEFRELIKKDYPDLAMLEPCGEICDRDKLNPEVYPPRTKKAAVDELWLHYLGQERFRNRERITRKLEVWGFDQKTIDEVLDELKEVFEGTEKTEKTFATSPKLALTEKDVVAGGYATKDERKLFPRLRKLLEERPKLIA